jgi:hypothetical protein
MIVGNVKSKYSERKTRTVSYKKWGNRPVRTYSVFVEFRRIKEDPRRDESLL